MDELILIIAFEKLSRHLLCAVLWQSLPRRYVLLLDHCPQCAMSVLRREVKDWNTSGTTDVRADKSRAHGGVNMPLTLHA